MEDVDRNPEGRSGQHDGPAGFSRGVKALRARRFDAVYVLLLRLAEHTGRSPDEIRTCLEVLRAMPQSMLLEAQLRLRPSLAMKERQVLAGNVFDMLFPGTVVSEVKATPKKSKLS